MHTAAPHFIDGRWVAGSGEAIVSLDPATGDNVWTGAAAGQAEIDAAIDAARRASSAWATLDVAERALRLQPFADSLKANREAFAEIISREVGKPRWESLTEVDAMIAKLPISVDALIKRRRDEAAAAGGLTTATRFKPHGVVAVFGPFNFPGHLPNGHIIPALLAGNTVIFKPSEHAPAVAQRTMELWQSAGLPAGVINLLQGARTTGTLLARHGGIDGLFFTGSVAAGKALSVAFADRPGKILALELGGNAPLVVHNPPEATAAAYLAVQSAFITSGQRCSCARRIIVPDGAAGDAFLREFVALSKALRVGPFSGSPEPFMGPVISDAAADAVLGTQDNLLARGGRSLLRATCVGPRDAMLSAGIIDMTGAGNLPDEETFGPLVKIIRTPDFSAAIDEANRTAFGLAAGLLGGTRAEYEQFYRQIRAGVVNWNRPTTAASSALPFGGVGLSGNHRPSAYFAADYCSYAVASLEDERLAMPATLTPGVPVLSPATPAEG